MCVGCRDSISKTKVVDECSHKYNEIVDLQERLYDLSTHITIEKKIMDKVEEWKNNLQNNCPPEDELLKIYTFIYNNEYTINQKRDQGTINQ